MRSKLQDLGNLHFDVLIVGAGANGASAAHQIAARGYNVLIVEKSDFASGTSSRSSRLLACGIQYLVPEPAYAGAPSWRSVFAAPIDWVKSLGAARKTMQCRTQLVRETPGRTRPATFFHPIYRDGQYPGWQVDLGFGILKSFESRDVPLNYERIPADEARRRYPVVRQFRQQDKLDSVAVYREYQYDWAERICVDAVLSAEQAGAIVRNYTAVTGIARKGGRWEFQLEDVIAAGESTRVTADVFVNAAGPWIDQVNALAGGQAKRRVVGIKGVNVLVTLPKECEGFGLECFNSEGQHFFAMPWGPHHFFGPTVTPFEGDPDDVRVTEDELNFVVQQANYLFPSANVTRASVVYAWAGVRPRTYYEGAEVRRRSSVVHELDSDGMPNALAFTEGPIMLHRDAGRRIADEVARRIKPSNAPGKLSFAPIVFPEDPTSPPLSPSRPEVKVAHLRHAVTHQHATNLVDLLFRRVRLGWDEDMGLDVARQAAESIADLLGWSQADIEAEVARYRAYVQEHFVARAGAEEQ